MEPLRALSPSVPLPRKVAVNFSPAQTPLRGCYAALTRPYAEAHLAQWAFGGNFGIPYAEPLRETLWNVFIAISLRRTKKALRALTQPLRACCFYLALTRPYAHLRRNSLATFFLYKIYSSSIL